MGVSAPPRHCGGLCLYLALSVAPYRRVIAQQMEQSWSWHCLCYLCSYLWQQRRLGVLLPPEVQPQDQQVQERRGETCSSSIPHAQGQHGIHREDNEEEKGHLEQGGDSRRPTYASQGLGPGPGQGGPPSLACHPSHLVPGAHYASSEQEAMA